MKLRTLNSFCILRCVKPALFIPFVLFTAFVAEQLVVAQDRGERATASSPISSAVAIHPENWATTADRDRSGSDGEGTTFFELTISSDGKFEQCRVTQSSGFAVFDRLTCSLMRQRARFRPAKDQNAQAIASTWANRVSWAKPGHNWTVNPLPADLAVTVSRLPTHIPNPARVGVLAVIGMQGEVEACAGQNKEFGVALNTIACQEIGLALPRVIARDQNGEARRILRYFSVEISVEPRSNGTQQDQKAN